MTRENIKFIRIPLDIGIIVATKTAHLNLEALKQEFGNNFNTFILNNKSGEELIILMDGIAVMYVQSGDIWSIDWEDGIIYDDIQITNNDAVNDTVANEIRISVGRTGRAKF